MSTQLTIDGREEEPREAVSARAPYTAAQHEIMELARRQGHVHSREAGRIVHLHREPQCARCLRNKCAFAPADGSEALKRLAKRGILRRVTPGLWIPSKEAT